MGGLNYDKVQKFRTEGQSELMKAGQFLVCQGYYPDCPEKPNILESKCRNCPQSDNIKKPHLEWVECEHCKEEGVPIIEGTKKEEVEETKCHVCGKINLKNYIVKKKR